MAMTEADRGALTLQWVEALARISDIRADLTSRGKILADLAERLGKYPDTVLIRNAPAEIAPGQPPRVASGSALEWSHVDTHEIARLLRELFEATRRVEDLERQLRNEGVKLPALAPPSAD